MYKWFQSSKQCQKPPELSYRSVTFHLTSQHTVTLLTRYELTLTHLVSQVRLVMQELRYSRLRVLVSTSASPPSPHICQELVTALEAAIHSLTVSLYPQLVSEARVRCPCLASKVTIITITIH